MAHCTGGWMPRPVPMPSPARNVLPWGVVPADTDPHLAYYLGGLCPDTGWAQQERGLHAAYRKYTLSTIFSVTMSVQKDSQQKPRKDCTYNAKELEQILPFKHMFIEASTIPERILILRSQILPAMFNYWATNGKDPRDQEESRSWAKVTSASSES
jgi:hypothetical protein